MNNESYTTQEVAKILKVSKLTVYDLIKKGELSAYKVGRQMRIEQEELDRFKSATKTSSTEEELPVTTQSQQFHDFSQSGIIISGQDSSLDLLSAHLNQADPDGNYLRSYKGSLNSLVDMYQNKCHIVSTHLYDASEDEYNIPFIRRILTGRRFTVVNLVSRQAGLYVQKNNPKHITGWQDLARPDVKLVNRETGSGARVLLDEQLFKHRISCKNINGYSNEETNHLDVAAAVARGHADAGVGIHKPAKMVDADFIPLITERYDLVMLKNSSMTRTIRAVISILNSPDFIKRLEAIGDYDLTYTGQIIYETES